MMDKTNNTSDNMFRYRRPQIKEIPVTAQKALCLSGDWATYSDPEEDQLP